MFDGLRHFDFSHAASHRTPTDALMRIRQHDCKGKRILIDSFACSEGGGCNGRMYTALIKQFIVESGEIITTTGIYRMVDHPERAIALINGDLLPTYQGKKVEVPTHSGRQKSKTRLRALMRSPLIHFRSSSVIP